LLVERCALAAAAASALRREPASGLQGTERPLTVDVNRLYVADPEGPSRFL
jgi:hypothetical protein